MGKPVRFGVERIYSKGPMARLRVLAELTEKPDGGTHLTYELWATPRNLVGSVAIPSQIKLLSAPKFRAAIHEYDKLASAGQKPRHAVRTLRYRRLIWSRLQALHQKLIESIADTDQLSRTPVADRLRSFSNMRTISMSVVFARTSSPTSGASRGVSCRKCVCARPCRLARLSMGPAVPIVSWSTGVAELVERHRSAFAL